MKKLIAQLVLMLVFGASNAQWYNLANTLPVANTHRDSSSHIWLGTSGNSPSIGYDYRFNNGTQISTWLTKGKWSNRPAFDFSDNTHFHELLNVGLSINHSLKINPKHYLDFGVSAVYKDYKFKETAEGTARIWGYYFTDTTEYANISTMLMANVTYHRKTKYVDWYCGMGVGQYQEELMEFKNSTNDFNFISDGGSTLPFVNYFLGLNVTTPAGLTLGTQLLSHQQDKIFLSQTDDENMEVSNYSIIGSDMAFVIKVGYTFSNHRKKK